MSVKLGDTVGAYRIVGELGAGGSGRVFRARHTITGRVEALKVLSDSGAPGSERAGRFLKEIRLQAKLDHPNIAIVHNAFWLDQTLVMVMEYVEGTSLRDLLASGPLAVGSVIEYGRQVLEALAYTHDNGVTHRDISPSNILITPTGGVKLTDFGLASITADPAEIKDGRVMGSAYYMSPEQVKSDPDIDHRADIYALGVVLYEALTGTRPFEADDVFSVMEAHVEKRPEAPSKHNPRLSAELDAVVLRALEKDREKRFSSVREFAKALDDLNGRKPTSLLQPAAAPMEKLQEEPAEHEKPAPAGFPTSPEATPQRFRKRWVAEALAGFAAVIALAFFLLPRFRSPPPEPSQGSINAEVWEQRVDTEPGEAASEPEQFRLNEEAPRTSGAAESPKSDAALAASKPSPSLAAGKLPLDGDLVRPSPLEASAFPKLPAPPPVDSPGAGTAGGDGAGASGVRDKPFETVNVLDAGGPIEAIALSRDGRSVAAAMDDGQIGVWDTGGKRMATLRGHDGRVTALAFSPDGKRLASGGFDGTAKVWDILRQREVRTLGHKGPVTSVSFSPDGLRLATGSDDKSVSVWDLTGKGAFHEYRGHKRPAQAVAFSPDGKTLVSTSREVRLWNTASDARPQTLAGLPEDAAAIAFSRDGAALAVAGTNEVGLWNFQRGGRQEEVRVPGARYALTFTAAGRCLAVSASSGPSGEVMVWDLANPDPLASLRAGGVLRSVAVTPAAEFMAAAGDEGRISLWRKNPHYWADNTKP